MQTEIYQWCLNTALGNIAFVGSRKPHLSAGKNWQSFNTAQAQAFSKYKHLGCAWPRQAFTKYHNATSDPLLKSLQSHSPAQRMAQSWSCAWWCHQRGLGLAGMRSLGEPAYTVHPTTTIPTRVIMVHPTTTIPTRVIIVHPTTTIPTCVIMVHPTTTIPTRVIMVIPTNTASGVCMHRLFALRCLRPCCVTAARLEKKTKKKRLCRQ